MYAEQCCILLLFRNVTYQHRKSYIGDKLINFSLPDRIEQLEGVCRLRASFLDECSRSLGRLGVVGLYLRSTGKSKVGRIKVSRRLEADEANISHKSNVKFQTVVSNCRLLKIVVKQQAISGGREGHGLRDVRRGAFTASRLFGPLLMSLTGRSSICQESICDVLLTCETA